VPRRLENVVRAEARATLEHFRRRQATRPQGPDSLEGDFVAHARLTA
jgi:hypothetical protein